MTNTLTTAINNIKPTSIFWGGFVTSDKVLIGKNHKNIWMTRIRDGKKCLYVRPETDKMRMLNWDGQLGGGYFAVFMDFDRVPTHLVNRFKLSDSMDMDSFEQYLRHEYPGECIFRSAGGNVKMMFIFHGCTRMEVTMELSECFPDLWRHCDHCGLFRSIVPYEAVDTLNRHIQHGEVRYGFDVDVVAKKWDMRYDEAIDKLVSDMDGDKQKLLLRFTLSMRVKGRTIILPMTLMAATCKCSTGTAKRFIDNAIARGDIECIDMTYCPKQKARVYRILNDAWLEAMKVEKTYEQDYSGVQTSMFVDGNWFNALWQHTRFFQSGIDFMLFVHSLDGAYRPGKYRLAKARSAWRSHAKRNGLSMEVC